MKSALGTKGGLFSIPVTGTLPSSSNQGMAEVGEFAKALRSATLNPLGENKKILTAVVGFGSYFEVDRAADAAKTDVNKQIIRSLSYLDSNGRSKTADFYNCSNITNSNAKKACNWGAKSHKELPTSVGGFGEGGFYSASSTEDIIESITTFVNDLDQTLPSAPAGTITIPSDPYRASNQLPYAYLPMLAPDVGSSASIWKGNLKKYNLDQGTLFGSNGKLYKNVAGDLSHTTQDVWQMSDFKNSKGVTANNDISAGGFYAQLVTPKSGLSSVRKLYVEDYVDATVSLKKPILRELSVDVNGKPVGFNELQDKVTYTELNKRRLLSFLGFKEATYGNNKIDLISVTDAKVSELTLVKPAEEIRVLGGVVHSAPTAVSYNATLDDNGRITASRDDYVLFGSMDGALHLADTKKG
jgi:type IV pilus assembly protein PilY1